MSACKKCEEQRQEILELKDELRDAKRRLADAESEVEDTQHDNAVLERKVERQDEEIANTRLRLQIAERIADALIVGEQSTYIVTPESRNLFILARDFKGTP